MSAGVEERLRDELGGREAPDEAAAGARSWRVVEAAFAERAPVRRRPRPLVRVALVTGLIAVALAAVLTPAGAEVGEWIEKRIGLGPDETQPTLRGFPGGGRLLAVGDTGAWVVNPGGGVRRLGDYREAGWSPRGLFVVGTRGQRITAMEPDGEPRWSFSRPGRLGNPAWSRGDGFRVAYLERLRGDTSVRVVDGSGGLDHRVADGAARVTPAWRPGRGYVLTYAGAGGVVTVGADGGRAALARAERGHAARSRLDTRRPSPRCADSARAAHLHARGKAARAPRAAGRSPGAGDGGAPSPTARRRLIRAERGLVRDLDAARGRARPGARPIHGVGHLRRARLVAERAPPSVRLAGGQPVAPDRRRSPASVRGGVAAARPRWDGGGIPAARRLVLRGALRPGAGGVRARRLL